MFIEYFDFFINCIISVFNTMKKFTLFGKMTYFDFVVFLIFITLLFKVINFIKGRDE